MTCGMTGKLVRLAGPGRLVRLVGTGRLLRLVGTGKLLRLTGAVLVEVTRRGSGSTLLSIDIGGSTLLPSVGITLVPAIPLAPLVAGGSTGLPATRLLAYNDTSYIALILTNKIHTLGTIFGAYDFLEVDGLFQGLHVEDCVTA